MFICFSILLLAIATAVTGSIWWWPVTHGYDFYRPIVLFIGAYIIGIAIWWVYIDLTGRITKKRNHNMSKYAQWIFYQSNWYICFLALCKVKFTGKEKLPKDCKFLFVCNHQGNFDPMIAYKYLGKAKIGFVTKEGNMRIPLGKHYLPLLNFIPINREDPLQSLQVFKKASDLISEGVCSMGVYPEGTRHRDGNVGDFHEGVFNIAVRSKCPIVVGTISGTNHITSNVPFKITKINLDILEVLYPEDYESKPAKLISDEIRKTMIDHLDKSNK